MTPISSLSILHWLTASFPQPRFLSDPWVGSLFPLAEVDLLPSHGYLAPPPTSPPQRPGVTATSTETSTEHRICHESGTSVCLSLSHMILGILGTRFKKRKHGSCLKKSCNLKEEMRHEHNCFEAIWYVKKCPKREMKSDRKSDGLFSSLVHLSGCPASGLGPLKNTGSKSVLRIILSFGLPTVEFTPHPRLVEKMC